MASSIAGTFCLMAVHCSDVKQIPEKYGSTDKPCQHKCKSQQDQQ